MHIDKNGWLSDATHIPSPNFDSRPVSMLIDLLVIHGISLPPGEFGGPWIAQLFSNTLDCDAHPYFAGLKGMRVSAHLLIRRDGEIVQFVSFNDRAWHAGVSSFQGRERCNDFSIGIELEGEDHRPYENVQYANLVSVTKILRESYPAITADHIKGHSDIAPGRKTDPGPAFDWVRFMDGIAT